MKINRANLFSYVRNFQYTFGNVTAIIFSNNPKLLCLSLSQMSYKRKLKSKLDFRDKGKENNFINNGNKKKK